jgi:AcrR family transcriptional regulator
MAETADDSIAAMATRSDAVGGGRPARVPAGAAASAEVVSTGLSDRQIVEAARQIVAESGVDGLTMRRLSARLGVTLGATYRHVPTKHALLLLVAEDLYDQIAVADRGTWSERVKQMMLDVAEVVRRHPGMASFMNVNARQSVPVKLNRVLVAILQDAGFNREGIDAVMAALFFYVTGMCASGFDPGASRRSAAARRAAVADLQDLFERGLDILLAGAEVTLEQSRPQARSGARRERSRT